MASEAIVDQRKLCGHSGCVLSLPTCCSCSDLRPTNFTQYEVYVDGIGMRAGTRWSFYCNPCRDQSREDVRVPPSAESHASNIDLRDRATEEADRHARVRLQNYQRVFGSQDEINDASYESPLTSMFTRAWTRYRASENDRQHHASLRHLEPGDAEAAAIDESISDLPAQSPFGRHAVRQQNQSNPEQTETLLVELQAISAELDNLEGRRTRGRQEGSQDEAAIYNRESSPAPFPEQDLSDLLWAVRPDPLPAKSLVNVECKICFAQVADILLLPCAHLIMCTFCAPSIKLVGPRDSRRDKCPMCRGKVSRVIRVYR